jgi:RNA polymerase sigma factor (sigma-70 family)
VAQGSPEDAVAHEAALVERALGGDAEAYGDLVTTHQAAAFRVAYLFLGSTDDAEDAAQEAFVRAYVRLRSFRRGEAFRPWLLAIVGNESRNRRRTLGRRARVLDRATTLLRGSDTGMAAAAEAVVLAGETRAEVRAALAALREEERAVVVCRYLLDLSEAESAAVLGIPPGTVKSRLSRGLARLRAELERAGAPLEASR